MDDIRKSAICLVVVFLSRRHCVSSAGGGNRRVLSLREATIQVGQRIRTAITG